jgi:hypothetical protein
VKLRVLFRCIAAAVCFKGPKALLHLVPLGDVVYDIAEAAYLGLKKAASDEEQRAMSLCRRRRR